MLSTGVGTPVPDDELIEQVWGDQLPGNVVQALRTTVNRLRAGLGPAIGPQYLRRYRAGYALTIPASLTDHGLLPELVARAQHHLADNDLSAATVDLESAAALWRGEPWADLGDQPELAGARARLAELYDTAVEELQAARLALGDTAAAIAALTNAVDLTPYRERRWELLALGLYRSGRQTEALGALRQARQLLRTDTGADPGPALRTLEHRILHHDPTLLAPRSAANSPHPISAAPPTSHEHTGHSATGPATALQIGLRPDALDPCSPGFTRFPALTTDSLRKANADNATRLRTAGYQVDNCLIGIGDAGADTARRALAARHYDTVFIGAGIQLGATDTGLLEAIINTAHTLQPHCRFMIDAEPVEEMPR
ncbi:AfsR/SARP family transcriptional regulator [Nocardia sp. NPDC004278]